MTPLEKMREQLERIKDHESYLRQNDLLLNFHDRLNLENAIWTLQQRIKEEELLDTKEQE